MYYWTCPYCGANLDPGERCDCEKEKPPMCYQHTDGKAGKELDHISRYHSISAAGKIQGKNALTNP